MMADPSYQYSSRQPLPQRKPLPHLQPDRAYGASNAAYTHSRTRTSSSSVFPVQQQQQQQRQQQPQPQMLYPNQSAYASRRTPSTGTFSTVASSGNGNGPVPNRNSTSTDLRRSTSSRSGGASQPTGYVALMRKQKATVWCDRAQHEDPRLLAAQRAAKLRAAIEVSGGSTAGRISTSGAGSLAGSNRVTAKIRHGGKAGLVGYNPSENFGVGVGGVPMRLSASEVEGNDSDDDLPDTYAGGAHHQRTGSGRSSLGSARRGLTYGRQSGASSNGRWSAGHTPPSERLDSLNSLAEETPRPGGKERGPDYFSGGGDGDGDGGSSGSSGERADAVGEMDGGAAKLASDRLLKGLVTREKSVRNPEELRRRGSVDERTMTMSMGAGRLFVANPDADSD